MPEAKAYSNFILFTSSNFPRGGAGATYLDLFCKGLTIHNFSVYVYLIRGHAFRDSNERQSRKNVTREGVHYSYLGLLNRPKHGLLKIVDGLKSFFNLFSPLTEAVRRKNKTIILVYQADFFHSVLIYSISKAFGIKTISIVPEYFNQSDFKGKLRKIQWNGFKFILQKMNPLSSGLIVFTHFLKEYYTSLGFREDCIYVQPNLTDFDFWEVPSQKEDYFIGYSGTPGSKDGLPFLFKAIEKLKKEFPVSLLVIGDTPYGKSMIPNLISVCTSLGIEDLVTFTGLVNYEQVKYLLSKCKITAITRPDNIQTKAGFPTKLGEYMALKKPVLATDFGEVSFYFSDGKEIIIADKCDPDSIAKKIRWLIQNNGLSATIGIKGYEKALSILEYKAAMSRIIEFMISI